MFFEDFYETGLRIVSIEISKISFLSSLTVIVLIARDDQRCRILPENA